MIRLIARKLAMAVVVLVLVSLGVTALSDLVPGSPAALILGDASQTEAVNALNDRYGFDKPFFERYWIWLRHALRGDLGESVRSDTPILRLLVDRLPITLQLAVMTIVLSLAIAIPVALVAGANEGGRFDRAVTAVSSALFSLPTFVGSVFLAQLLSVRFKVLPTYGWVRVTDDLSQNLVHAVLPVTVLVVVTTPLLLRVLRADVVSILREDFVLAARARGMSTPYILLRHVLRPASISLFTLTGLVFGFLVGGSIIVESYFALPGIGAIVGQAVSGKDLPIVQGVVVMVALVYLVLNTFVDIGNALIDPRIRSRQ